MSSCPWDRGESLARNGPPPPPIRRRSHETTPERLERIQREEERREKRFDPETPPARYAQRHHFAVNANSEQFEAWLRKVDGYVLDQFDDEVGYLDLDEAAFQEPDAPEWAGGQQPSACLAWGAGLSPEEYFDWLMTSVRITDEREED
jgi:hypothetical protein